MRCPTLNDLPPAPPDRIGWPWTEESQQLPSKMPDGSPWPKVSIVTPSYNQGQFIEETIRSVLLQGYPNLEYIIIDGGSTDGSVDIIRKYEPWLAYWVSEPDDGQVDAINKGFARSRGEIIAWLNSDDTYLRGALQTQADAFSRHPECGIVYGDALYVEEDGEPLYTIYGRPFSPMRVLRLSIPVQPATFIHRRVYKEIGPLDRGLHYALDSEYWMRACGVAPFWYEPTCLAAFRLHDVSKTVASHRGFYKEWTTAAEAFFQNPDLSGEQRAKEDQVLADIYTRIATIEAERGSLAETYRYLRMALAKGGGRVRMFKLLPILLDRYLPLNVTPRLTQFWTRLQSRSSSS